MKLIVDAQLPVKLCEILEQIGLESIHVDNLPKGDETPDVEITEYADLENLIVVTKDFDFYHSNMTLGKPKKLFLITTGNLKNSLSSARCEAKRVRTTRIETDSS
jgi:predicted nuclease of predicted toxin-antitoxin system